VYCRASAALCLICGQALRIREERLVDRDQLLETVHLNKLVDVLVGIRGCCRILILHLRHEQRKKVAFSSVPVEPLFAALRSGIDPLCSGVAADG